MVTEHPEHITKNNPAVLRRSCVFSPPVSQLLSSLSLSLSTQHWELCQEAKPTAELEKWNNPSLTGEIICRGSPRTTSVFTPIEHHVLELIRYSRYASSFNHTALPVLHTHTHTPNIHTLDFMQVQMDYLSKHILQILYMFIIYYSLLLGMGKNFHNWKKIKIK